MNASELMTTPAITVEPHAPVRRVATLLVEHRVSALPVVSEGRLVGIVSEADLLHRHELGTACASRTPWWLRPFAPGDCSAEAYIRAHAMQVRDVMTHEVATVNEDTTLPEIVALLEGRRVRRLPVVRGAHVVGIVSRSDVVRALAAYAGEPEAESNDLDIVRRLLRELDGHDWWRAAYSSVSVTGGIVHFRGLVFSERERDASRIAAENIGGVRAVRDHRFRCQQVPSLE